MTETSFQVGRKVMQKANYLRGIITKRKGEVAKWTAIEDSHRRELRHGQADGAKKMLDKALVRLEEVREKFKAIKFPADDMPADRTDPAKCQLCSRPVGKDEVYCEDCIYGK